MIEIARLVTRSFLPFTGPQTWGSGGATDVYAVEILFVGGGGGGGFNGGGGGGGGLHFAPFTVASGGPYAVTIGAGGTAGSTEPASGGDGGATSIAGIGSIAGGGGGGCFGSDTLGYVGQPGRPGACGGGGGGGRNAQAQGLGGAGSAGGAGGNGLVSMVIQSASGGGGGHTAPGTTPTFAGGYHGGAGGPGIAHVASGASVLYCWGGGGYGTDTYGPNGDGSPSTAAPPANCGAGGGWLRPGSAGLLILRYAGGKRGTGGAESNAGGYYLHTFTASGTFIA